jgi:hypothetical protein
MQWTCHPTTPFLAMLDTASMQWTPPACTRYEMRWWISCMHGLCIWNNASSGSFCFFLWTLMCFFYLIKTSSRDLLSNVNKGAMWAGRVCLFCDFWACRRCDMYLDRIDLNQGKSLVKVQYKLVDWNIVRFLYVSYLQVKVECIHKNNGLMHFCSAKIFG